jgi:hypothetical protein
MALKKAILRKLKLKLKKVELSTFLVIIFNFLYTNLLLHNNKTVQYLSYKLLDH